MIYLIRSYGINRKSFLKVGFTNNPKIRLDSYFYHNPGSEIISTRDGDEILESLLHIYLSSLGLQYKKNGKLNEWFQDDPRVYQIFHIHRSTLERKIWKHRDEIFDVSSRLDYKLFEYLYLKNKDSFVGEEIEIIDGKAIKTSAKRIDIIFWKLYCRKNLDNIFEFASKDYHQGGENLILQDFLDNHFYSTGIFREKMKMYCDFRDTYGSNPDILKGLDHKIQDTRFKMYYEYYGTQGCRSVGYQEAYLYRGWKDDSKIPQLQDIIMSIFKSGERYPMSEIKETLGGIYKSLGITKTPKATDLGEYFEIKKIKMTLPDKTVTNGFKLT